MIVRTQVSKKRNEVFNSLSLKEKEYDAIKQQMASLKTNKFILRSLSGKSNVICQLIVKKSQDDECLALLSHNSYFEENEEYSSISVVKSSIEVNSIIKVRVEFVSDALNLLFISQVLDVEDIIKRQLIRQEQIFCNHTIFQVKLLENQITLKVSSVEYEDAVLLNEMFTCTNFSFLEIDIDYSSLLRFSRFYRIPKSTYLYELTNLIPNQEIESSISKFTQWLQYSSKSNQNSDDTQFLDPSRLMVTLKTNGTQKQEMKAQILKYMLKKQIDLFTSQVEGNDNEDDNISLEQTEDNNEMEEEQSENVQKLQNKMGYKIRYLNLRDILTISSETHLESFFKQVVECIKKEESISQNKIILIIDSCEYFMEQDKYNENIGKFNTFKEFIKQIRACLLLSSYEKKSYYKLPEVISNINF